MSDKETEYRKPIRINSAISLILRAGETWKDFGNRPSFGKMGKDSHGKKTGQQID
jgi:hypothetical protein